MDETAKRAIALFKYIRDLSGMRSRIATDIDTVEKKIELASLTRGAYVEVSTDADAPYFLRVVKPPVPSDGEDQAEIDIFRATDELFSRLYQWRADLEREPEVLEIVAADCVVTDRDTPGLRHPVFVRRARLRFDASEDAILVEDTDTQTEVFAELFRGVRDLSYDAVKHAADALAADDAHPFDCGDRAAALVRELTSDSEVVPTRADVTGSRRLSLYMSPTLMLRRRPDGTRRVADAIIEDIETRGTVPPHISAIVGGRAAPVEAERRPQTIDEILAAAGGEDLNILLSKPANGEQLEIARRISTSAGVIVQGPPGTGKTHTISNILGHLLASGAKVLVTSHTRKALSVLKDKIAADLRALCVSSLDSDSRDMEKSVDAILDFMGAHSSEEMRRRAESIAKERGRVMGELATARREQYAAMLGTAAAIEFDGEHLSIADAADLVRSTDMSAVPGPVSRDKEFSLSWDELRELYELTSELSCDDELAARVPIVSESELDALDAAVAVFEDADDTIRELLLRVGADGAGTGTDSAPPATKEPARQVGGRATMTGRYLAGGGSASVPVGSTGKGSMTERFLAGKAALHRTGTETADTSHAAPHAAVSTVQSVARARWDKLLELVETASAAADAYAAISLGRTVDISGIDLNAVAAPLKKLADIFARKGKVGTLTTMFDASLSKTLGAVRVDGHELSSEDDCRLASAYAASRAAEHRLVPAWAEMCGAVPLAAAPALMPRIRAALDWQSAIAPSATSVLDKIGVRVDTSRLTEETLREIASAAASAREGRASALQSAGRAARRRELSSRLRDAAPAWADALDARDAAVMAPYVRAGSLPDPSRAFIWSVWSAWRARQLESILDDIVSLPYEEPMERAAALAPKVRSLTGELAAALAWQHILKQSEESADIKQALQGWRLTVKKIGKGTGRTASRYRARARELMAACQNAVPVWIMPAARALEMLDPRVNRFDVVIMDEASQSDITELALLYMGARVIIVGDDKQVSPMAVGSSVEAVENLRRMYIDGVIPNDHLYEANTSIYDIAATTFAPLALREHFRCVPDIIRWCSALSYDGKIKPLRDPSSTNLSPAVLYDLVDAGPIPEGSKVNTAEARRVAALMRACFDDPEYAGRSFGAITATGSEQTRAIENAVLELFSPAEIERARILCGTPANFQGDERDVIFLSMVDAPSSDAPLRRREQGAGDSWRKRMNVAVSRACDQLWVVTSLSLDDLKPGDIRGSIIGHARSVEQGSAAAVKDDDDAGAPFVREVADALKDMGYRIDLGRRIGGWQIDIVAEREDAGRTLRAAVECDGPRTSAEASAASAMEMQTVLERSGWKFVRIRSCDWSRDRERALARLAEHLSAIGVHPDSGRPRDDATERRLDTVLRIRERADTIARKKWGDKA